MEVYNSVYQITVVFNHFPGSGSETRRFSCCVTGTRGLERCWVSRQAVILVIMSSWASWSCAYIVVKAFKKNSAKDGCSKRFPAGLFQFLGVKV